MLVKYVVLVPEKTTKFEFSVRKVFSEIEGGFICNPTIFQEVTAIVKIFHLSIIRVKNLDWFRISFTQ